MPKAWTNDFGFNEAPNVEQVGVTCRTESAVQRCPQPQEPVTTFDTPLAPEANEIRAEAIESTPPLTDLQIPLGGILVKRL